MFLPSKLITELVIDVINAVTVISANINIDELLSIILLDIPIVFGSVSSDTILSYLIAITIVAITNSTNANPELIINTGVLKYVFNSFFIKEIVAGFDLITRLSIFTFLEVDIFFNLEFILK